MLPPTKARVSRFAENPPPLADVLSGDMQCDFYEDREVAKRRAKSKITSVFLMVLIFLIFLVFLIVIVAASEVRCF